MAPQTQVRRIVVEVDARDSDGKLRVLQRGFANLNQGIKGTTTAVTSFRNAFLALQGLSFAGFGIGSLVNTVDEVQRLNNRLTLTEGSAEGAAKAFESLTGIANDNLTSVTDIASVYARLNASLRETGISSQALIGFTDTLQKTFRISGSTTQEATATIIQLSQALASGELRGQELRSVLEQNAVAGELLAKRFGVTRGELLKLSDKRGGFKTVEVLEALSQGFNDVNERAAKLSPTIGDTLTANFNRLRVGVNELNTQFEITRNVSGLINTAFQNLDIAAAIVGVVGAVKLYTLAISAATQATIAFNFVASGSLFATLTSSALVGGVVKLGIALLSLKAGLVVAAAAAVGFGASFISSIPPVKEAEERLKKANAALGVTIETGNRVEISVAGLGKQFDRAAQSVSTYRASQTDLGQAFERTFKTIATGQQEVLVLSDNNKGLSGTYVEQIENITAAQRALRNFTEVLRGSQKISFDYKGTLAALNQTFLEDRNIVKYNKALKDLELFKLNKDFKEGSFSVEEYDKKLREIEFGKIVNRAQELRNDFAELNKEFGQFGNVEEYAKRLNTLTFERNVKDFEEGRTNLLDFNKALTDRAIEKYNLELAKGAITLEAYNRGTEALQIKQLNESFRAGVINIFDYNRQLVELEEKFNPSSALFTGTSNYIRQAGTLSQNIANGVTQTFGRLEEFFTDFTKTGRFNFREFAAGVIDDLNKIIVRALIIRPLAQGILGSFAGGADISTAGQTDLATGSTANLAANGASFNGSKATFFAKGGVVNRPTGFTFNGGKMGVMGEAGPEAILPLRRTSSGDLGVRAEATPANVFVNIINQSGNSVEQRETTNSNGERVIEILVLSTVKEGIASGAFDRQFNQTFGLARKGG